MSQSLYLINKAVREGLIGVLLAEAAGSTAVILPWAGASLRVSPSCQEILTPFSGE